jgi:hypothetical protein
MQIQVDIGFEQLVEIVKGLPEGQQLKLKKEIENNKSKTVNDDLRLFLMDGPVFSKLQLDEIAQTSTTINQWRMVNPLAKS